MRKCGRCGELFDDNVTASANMNYCPSCERFRKSITKTTIIKKEVDNEQYRQLLQLDMENKKRIVELANIVKSLEFRIRNLEIKEYKDDPQS